LGLGSESRRELARLGLVFSDHAQESQSPTSATAREDGYWITAVLLDRGRLWSASHAIPRYTLTAYRWSYPTDARGDAHWRLAYPRAFPELVSKNSKANRVPEALQFAIMREESAFVPKAESFANALGLTQMLVRTAQRFATWHVTREALLDPSRNLDVGSRFLAFLLDHFGGALPLVIAGYNAGENAVDRWLRERGTLDLDEFLETIPYDETRNYTKRVLASVFAYSWLYLHDQPVPALSFALPKVEAKKPEATKGK
jgi:soluble lytic murein transglycosylase